MSSRHKPVPVKLLPWTPFKQGTLPKGVDCGADYVLVNSRYHVFVKDCGGGITHLSVKRNDKEVLHDWRDLQRIKNEVCGPEREAVEIYPAESRMVDMANQYHLWVMPEDVPIPFGFNEGRLVRDAGEFHPGDAPAPGAKQRPFSESSTM